MINTRTEHPISLKDRSIKAISAKRWQKLDVLLIAILFLIAYIPMLLTKPGIIGADTKVYLYISPSFLIKSAPFLWSNTESVGSVTHQNIGYLFPMGPYYYLCITLLHIPAWIAQRIWFGGYLFFGALGIYVLSKEFNYHANGAFSAGLLYALSPYALQYIPYLSAIILPYTALGWLLLVTIRALKTNNWLYIILFTLIIAFISPVNATALAYVLIAPILWILYCTITKECSLKRSITIAAKLALGTLLISIWWISGLYVEDRFGIPILKVTETVQAVASTSSPLEVFRTIGYWYFYISDAAGSVLPASIPYQSWLWLIALSFFIPTAIFVSSIFFKFTHKAFFVVLGFAGLVISVGAHPYNSPTPFGKIFKIFMNSTTTGEALRSTDRATPLYLFGISMLLGGFISSVSSKFTKASYGATFLISGLILLNNPGLFIGNYVASTMEFTAPPQYLNKAANYLSQNDKGYRALIEPGQDFSYYTYGYTNDPTLVGLTNSPVYERVQVPYGTQVSDNLTDAFDYQFQNNYLNSYSVAPMMRLLGVKSFINESDYNWELYEQPDPKYLYQLMNPLPKGLGKPLAFGKNSPNPPPANLPSQNEQSLSISPSTPWPNPFLIYPVANPRKLVHLESPKSPIVLDGDGGGILNTAATGLLSQNQTIFYSGTLEELPGGLNANLPSNSTLVISDTNRKEERIYTTLRDYIGATLAKNSLPDKTVEGSVDAELFKKLGTDAESVATFSRANDIFASSYGNDQVFTPELRPSNAFDGHSYTSWLTSGFTSAIGQWIQINLAKAINLGYITIYQANVPLADRIITQVKITLNGSINIIAKLGPESLTKRGQIVRFPKSMSLSSLRVTITKTRNLYDRPGVSPVGFSQIGLPTLSANANNYTEFIRPPVDLLKNLENATIADRLHNPLVSDRLVYVFNREMTGSFPPRSSPELSISRVLQLPSARTFMITGTADISAYDPDQEIDTIIGRYPPGSYPGASVVTFSGGRLLGDLSAEAASAFDNNLTTFWEPSLGTSDNKDMWIEADLPHILTEDSMNLSVLNDGFHSVPTKIQLSTEQGIRILKLNHPSFNENLHIDTFRLKFLPLTGRDWRITVLSYKPKYTTEYGSQSKILLPFAVAEVGLAGITAPPAPPKLPSACRADLIQIKSKTGQSTPVWVSLNGSTSIAMENKFMSFKLCGPDQNGISLQPGTYYLTTTNYKQSGIDINQVVLDSGPNNRLEIPSKDNQIPGAPTPACDGYLKFNEINPAKLRVSISNLKSSCWLVLGESYDPGWRAYENGKSLGKPILIDGYANAWKINPSIKTVNLLLYFKPQLYVDFSLLISIFAFLLCLFGLFAYAVAKFRRKESPRHLAKSVRSDFMGPELKESHLTTANVPIILRLIVPFMLALTVFAFTDIWAAGAALVSAIIILNVKYSRLLIALGILCLSCYVVGEIIRNEVLKHLQYGSGWPSYFDYLNPFLYSILALVFVEMVVFEILKYRQNN